LVESAYRGEASRAGWTTEADLLDGQRTDAAAVAETVASASSIVLVAVDEAGSLVACCQLDRHDDGISHFGLFAVRPGLQSAGVGRNLLGHAEHYARDMFGAHTLELTVIAQRIELIGWYERRGYQRTGQTRPFPYGDERFGLPRRDDLHFVVMSKPLSST